MLEFLYRTSINHYFLSDVLWNLFLAALPCALTLAMFTILAKRKWLQLKRYEQFLFIPLFILWLFFLPNTIYLIAMVRHLIAYCDHPLMSRVCPADIWKIMFFFFYALIGVPTFIYCVERMSRIMHNGFGKWVGTIFPIVIIPISTIGMLIGLVRRVNSWDIIHYPAFIVKDTWYYFSRPASLENFAVYVVGIYTIYYGGIWFSNMLRKVL